MEQKPVGSFITLPGAIVIGAAIIGVAIMWTKRPLPAPVSVTASSTANVISVAPVTTTDHIFGNPNAPIKLVEYSDPSCPYCKIFNPTMEDIISTYGVSGQVAWIYRHYPLDKADANGNVLHPNAGHEAQALECVASLGGNSKFWAFEKHLYETTPSDKGLSLDQKKLPTLAKDVGVDPVSFNDCLASGKFKSVVDANFLDGVNAGVNGTPTTFIMLDTPAGSYVKNYVNNALLQYKIPTNVLYMSGDNKIIALAGAMPEALVKGLLDAIQTGSATK